MVDGDVKRVGAAWRSGKIREKSDGMLLDKNGIDDILRLLSKKGYRSYEALELRKEMEQLKRKYDELIKQQSNMPGKDMAAEAVVKYYLFQLEKLKRNLPYDAMGCKFSVPLLVLQEFERETIAEDICEFIGNSDEFNKEKLQEEIQKFIIVRLEPRGQALYMELLEHGNNAE